MANDPTIKLKIETEADVSGLQAAQVETDKLNDSTSKSGNTSEEVAKKKTKMTAAEKEAAAHARNMGLMVNNLSYQMNDLVVQVGSGTNAITAFAQQAPQMLQALQMAGVVTGSAATAVGGFALALPLVAFGSRALFNWLSESSDKTSELTERTKQLKAAGDFYKDAAEERKKLADEAAAAEKRQLDAALQSIETRRKIENDQTGLDAARQTTQTTVEIIQERLKLVRLEGAISEASAEKALSLAKEREATVMRIYDKEREIEEIARNKELATAETNVTAAAAKVDTLRGSDAEIARRYDKLAGEMANLQTTVNEYNRAWGEKEKSLRDELYGLKAEKQRLENQLAGEQNPGTQTTLNFSIAQLNGRIADLEATYKEAQDKLKQGSPSAKQLEAKQPELDALKSQVQASADAQREAAKAMATATIALSNLRQAQDTAKRQTEAGVAERELLAMNRDVTQGIKDALEQIKASAAARGVSLDANGFPGRATPEGAAADSLQKLLTDQTADGAQGGRLAEILQTLSSTLAGKDEALASGVGKLISIARAQEGHYKELSSRIDDLENLVNQKAGN